MRVQSASGRRKAAFLSQSMTVLPPIGKQSHYPALQLAVIRAQERDVPPGRPGIECKLLSNLPVQSRAEAIAPAGRPAA